MSNIAPVIPARSDIEWCWFLRRHGRAGDMIERALHDIGVMDCSGWARWQRSSLTNTGAPVAVTFSTGDEALSITTEVADPGSDPKTRFATACEAITTLGGTPPSPAFREVLSAAQGASALTYGARLGLRHDGHALQITLYAELSTAASDLSTLITQTPVGTQFEGFGPDAQPTMLAYDAQTQQVTLYCNAQGAADIAQPSYHTEELQNAGGLATKPAQPVAHCYGHRDVGADPVLAHQFCLKDISRAGATVEMQLRSLKRQILHRYPCLTDHPHKALTDNIFGGHYWLHTAQNGKPIVSIDVAAPWLGSDPLA